MMVSLSFGNVHEQQNCESCTWNKRVALKYDYEQIARTIEFYIFLL